MNPGLTLHFPFAPLIIISQVRFAFLKAMGCRKLAHQQKTMVEQMRKLSTSKLTSSNSFRVSHYSLLLCVLDSLVLEHLDFTGQTFFK